MWMVAISPERMCLEETAAPALVPRRCRCDESQDLLIPSDFPTNAGPFGVFMIVGIDSAKRPQSLLQMIPETAVIRILVELRFVTAVIIEFWNESAERGYPVVPPDNGEGLVNELKTRSWRELACAPCSSSSSKATLPSVGLAWSHIKLGRAGMRLSSACCACIWSQVS